MKVAQYEVLGSVRFRRRVPLAPKAFGVRDDRWMVGGWERKIISIVPIETDAFLSFDSRHFVPGYFRNVPSGQFSFPSAPRQPVTLNPQQAIVFC
jgi:hypothetical protein